MGFSVPPLLKTCSLNLVATSLLKIPFSLKYAKASERAIVHKLAPHLVIPEKMILPLIDGGTYGSWLTSFGLKVYDVLATKIRL